MDFLQGMLSLPVVDPRNFLIDGNTPVVLGCFMFAHFPWQAHTYYKARGYTSRIVRHLGIEYAQVEPLLPHEHAIVELRDAETEKAISELAAKIEAEAGGLVKRICARALCPDDYAFIPARFDALVPHPRGHPLFLVDLLTIHLRPTPRVQILLKQMRENGLACASPDGHSEDAWDHILRNVGGVRQCPGRDFYSVVAPPVGRIEEHCSEGLLCYSIERDVHTDGGMMHFAVRPAEIQMYDRLDL
jgi:hypothetical protein